MQKMTKIDRKDQRILAALEMNARKPLTQVAKEVGLSRQMIEYRIKRMQKEHIIFGAHAVFDSVVVGYHWYRVMLSLLNITKEEKATFMTYLTKHPNILWVGELGGNWDLAVNLICRDNFAFNAIFEEIIKRYGHAIHDYEMLIYVDVYDFARRYLFEAKEQTSYYHEMKYNPHVNLDHLDYTIITALAKNAWITNLELGQKFNVSANTIHNRIETMIQNKLLLGFRLFINPSSLGYKSHMLFLEIHRLDIEKEKKLYAYLKTISNISFIVKHIGRWRIGMEIETKDEQEFQEIFVDIRGKFSDSITGFESCPLFKDHAVNYFPEGIR